MNKKVLGIILLVVFILWIIYIVADCIRINNFSDKPFITISEKNYDNVEQINNYGQIIEVGEYGTTYIGLGYTKTIYKKWQVAKDLPKLGFNIKLFGIITISGFEYH